MTSAAPHALPSLPQRLQLAALSLSGIELQTLTLKHDARGSSGTVYLTRDADPAVWALNVRVESVCEQTECGPRVSELRAGAIEHVDASGKALPLSAELRATVRAWVEFDRGLRAEIAQEWGETLRERDFAHLAAG